MTVPEGLIYVPGFVTEAEERDVLAVLATFECILMCCTTRHRGGWSEASALSWSPDRRVSGATARHKLVEIQREDAFPPPAV